MSGSTETSEAVDELAETAYRNWCFAQGAEPRPWTGRDALPDNRKWPWRSAIHAVLRAQEAANPRRQIARVVAIRPERHSA